MTATNHGLSGMVLGAVLPIYLAIPVAFASHFILDTLPHYGIAHNKRNKSFLYKTIVFTDTVIALSFAFISAYMGKWNMFWVGWVAYSPDLMWVVWYFKNSRSLEIKPKSWLAKFHKNIQKRESESGIYIELLFFVLLLLPTVIYFLTQ